MDSARANISDSLPSLVLGGAGFSYLTHPDPESLPVVEVIKQAFDHGMRAIDTAPFYEPSEQLLGQALAHPDIRNQYSRSDYILVTKVGRTGREDFDYSPAAVRESVERSLKRLGTPYLDIVFCHDMEFVTDQDVLGAVAELLKFVDQGVIRWIGLSSYRLDLLAHRSLLVREKYGRPIDAIQTWAHLTLQNTLLESEGLDAFKAAGVSCVFSSSPLAIGLLRKGGVPKGKQGDTHPAPPGLRAAVQELADYMDSQGESPASVALRFSLGGPKKLAVQVCMFVPLTGISRLPELTENLEAAKKLLDGDLRRPTLNLAQVERDQPLFSKAKEILGDWVNWSFTLPGENWSQELKRRVDKPEMQESQP